MDKTSSLQDLSPNGLQKDPKSSSVHNALMSENDNKYAVSLLKTDYKIFPFDGEYNKPGICVADVNYFFNEAGLVVQRLSAATKRPLVMLLNLGRMGKYCLEQRDPDRVIESAKSSDVIRDIVLEAKELQVKLVADIRAVANPSPRLIAKSVEAFYAPKQVQRPRTA